MVKAGFNKHYPITADSISEIEKLHRIDGVDWQTIEEVIVWCQGDEFWKMNILSGSKLRKQFPRLLMQSQFDVQKKEEEVEHVNFV